MGYRSGVFYSSAPTQFILIYLFLTPFLCVFQLLEVFFSSHLWGYPWLTSKSYKNLLLVHGFIFYQSAWQYLYHCIDGSLHLSPSFYFLYLLLSCHWELLCRSLCLLPFLLLLLRLNSLIDLASLSFYANYAYCLEIHLR